MLRSRLVLLLALLSVSGSVRAQPDTCLEDCLDECEGERDLVLVHLRVNIPIVDIEVDGEPRGDLGSLRDGVLRVPPGVHTLTFSHPAVQPLSVEIEVPGGTDEYTLSPISLTWRDAVLIVDGDLDGGVFVDDTLVGQVGEQIRIPINSPTPRRRVAVNVVASGQLWTDTLNLVPAQRLRVTLEQMSLSTP